MMKSLLTSSNFASIEMDSARRIREAKEARWENLQFLNGVQGHLKETLATLYENEAKHLIYEATTADNSGSFETVVFPLIRRVFSKLLANDIVSVQAMDLPIGKIFFIKPVTSEREWEVDENGLNTLVGKHHGLMGYQRTNKNFDGSEFDANDPTRRSFESYARYALPDEAINPVQTASDKTMPEVTKFMKKSLYDLFYDDFLYDHSKGRITIKVGNVDVVKMDAMGDYVPALYDNDVPSVKAVLPLFPAAGGAPEPTTVEVVNTLLLRVGGFSSFNAGHLTGPDGNEMDTESFLASLKVIAASDITNEKKDDNDDVIGTFETATYKAGEAINYRVMTQRYGSPIVEGVNPNICDNDGHLYIELDLRKPASRPGLTLDGYVGILKEQLGFSEPCDPAIATFLTNLTTGADAATTRSEMEAIIKKNINTAKAKNLDAAIEEQLSNDTMNKIIDIVLGEIWKNYYQNDDEITVKPTTTPAEIAEKEAAIVALIYKIISNPEGGKLSINNKEIDLTKLFVMACTSDKLAGLFNIVWAQYDSLEYESEMGEVSFQLVSETVSVQERKLRASWTPELAQDVMAFHNVDAEAELTAILSEQIAAEVDREILRDLRRSAPWVLRWDYNGWRKQMTTSTNYTQKDWNQTLITNVNIISAQIQKATLRGGANFIVVSPEISAVLNDLEYFHVTDANAEAESYNLGIEKVGSLQGRYQVIVDPYAPAKTLLMGHHGSSLLDAGYVYCPYVPMALTPTMTNFHNFTPVKGIATRYAKKMLNNKFYGRIDIDGLIRFATKELR